MTQPSRLFPFQLTPGAMYGMVTSDNDTVVWGGRLCAKEETGAWLLFESGGKYAFTRFDEEYGFDARFVTTTADGHYPAPPTHDLRKAIPFLLKRFHTNKSGDVVSVITECETHRNRYVITDYDMTRESIPVSKQNCYFLPASATTVKELLEAEEMVCTH